jgi:tetratricopeptide (TPR) repeat protein
MKKVLLVWGQLLILAAMAAATANGLVSSAASAEQEKTIKDPAENTAYQSALNTSDPMDKAAALEAFVARYPSSIVKGNALEQAMEAYQMAGNLARVAETAKRTIAVDDSNVRALALLAFLTRAQVAEANLTNLPDLCSSSQRGVTVLPGWKKPEGMTDADFGSMKNGVAEIFYGGSGLCALSKKAYDVARENYLKALAINPEDVANNFQLGMAELESSPSDQNGFSYLAKAMQLAEQQHNRAAAASIEQYGKSKYKKQNGSDDGWNSFISASLHTPPPSVTTASNKKGPTDAEAACQAVKDNALEELSFSDWEVVLQ